MALQSFTASSATDALTASGHTLRTGDSVFIFGIDAAVLPAPLREGNLYGVVRVDANTIKLAADSTHAAMAIGTIDLTSNGTGTLCMQKWPAT
jgi:hypothetical protein